MTFRASSLTNAIFLCLIISVFCGCLVLVSHYHNVLNDRLYTHEDLISRNESSFNFLLNNSESMSYNQSEFIDVFDHGISSSVYKKNWGFYDILVCKTAFKQDTVSKIALVGQRSNENNNLAVFVTNYDKPLKLSGKAKILGQIKVPNGRIERAYINGRNGNDIELHGQQLKSENKLPRIEKDIVLNVAEYETIHLNTLDDRPVIVNAFDEVTKVLNLNETRQLNHIVCKGNIVLKSDNGLKITKTAVLNDVIVSAPFVHIMSGFKGNIQIVAKDSVIIDKHVQLRYPSSIYIKNNGEASITLEDDSVLIGGVVIDGEAPSGTSKRLLTIKKRATVVGNIYCNGSTQLKGKVIGNIYTDKFFLKTKSSNYENVILNGSINRDSLPKDFIGLPLFKTNYQKSSYAVIKEF